MTARGKTGPGRIVLIRHGRTEGIDRGLLYGATELPVTERGLAELRERAQRGAYPEAADALVLTSGMLRTEQTLRAIYGEIPHRVWRSLREIDCGAFEMRSFAELQADGAFAAWLAGTPQAQGETFAQAQARILRGLRRMLRQERDVLAVVHGGTIITIMQTFFSAEGRTDTQWLPEPGCGYEIDCADMRWRAIGQLQA